MTRLVALESDSANPFRLLGPGSDPDNPLFSDIIFDSNVATYLTIQEGAFSNVTSSFYAYGAGTAAGVPLVKPVSGRRPLFLCCSDSVSNGLYGGISGYMDLPFRGWLLAPTSGDPFGGCGLLVNETHVYPLNFNQTSFISSGGIGQFIPRPRTVRYVVLSNTV